MFKNLLEAQATLQVVMTDRLAHEQEARKLKKQENIIEEWIITKCKLGNEYPSEHNIVSVYDKLQFTTTNKEALERFVLASGDMSLLISRLNTKTALAYYELKKPLSGVSISTERCLAYRSI